MSDLYELQLVLDLPDSLPDTDLALLQWHLGERDDDPENPDAYPLLASRGPASRIGGALVGVLVQGARGWALTVRQEVHPDEFDRLRELVVWLGRRTSTFGAIGYLRFLENDVPDVLVADTASGTVRRLTPTSGPAEEIDPIPDPWG
ncbi:hypothetical protein ABT173_31570 [Streptomyces sp. NPDC001795]|uniref:hypothetical protein n=1 Tax=Streptomyces sp. NPDC001795 TaxID=3154525 RepID=UPI00331E6C08